MLIDDLHAATWQHNPQGLGYMLDKRAFREVLKRAHCYTLDDETSYLMGQFSVPIISDLEAVRELALPPWPVMWIEFNNRLRLQAMVDLGFGLTDAAKECVERVGWLIDRHPIQHTAFRLTYCTKTLQGAIVAPMAFFWDIAGNACPWEQRPKFELLQREPRRRLLFNIGSDYNPSHAFSLCPMPGGSNFEYGPVRQMGELQLEIAGELRYCLGLMLAMNGAASDLTITKGGDYVDDSVAANKLPNGKPQFAIVHKRLVIHLHKNRTPQKIAERMITGHKKKWHEVSGHWRTLRNADGTVRKRVPVKSHERGDARLGRVYRTNTEVRK